MKRLRLAASVIGIALFSFAASPSSAAPRPVTVTIASVACTQAEECDAGGIEAFGQSWPDFYARVFINGVQIDTPRAKDDQERVEPFWVVSTIVDDAMTPQVPITIQIWDYDSTSGDDIADASPQPDHNNLDLTLDMATGRWAGDTSTACATGDGVDTDDDEYYPVKVCFDISTVSNSGDADADGLLDGWERLGFDADGDGIVDVDLPAMGANPMRKDLFLELDYETGREPTRDGINAFKAAFAAAPLPNPDGSSGVTLHVDVGPLLDSTADEAGRAGTCSNGIDDNADGVMDQFDPLCQMLESSREVGAPDCLNGIDDDGDGLADAADPQCLVGDNLGGGTALSFGPAARPCGLNDNFATTKSFQFNPNRAWIFRYAMQTDVPPDPPAGPPLNCPGGEGEIGGNDFVAHNLDAGTLMHEFGHNLNLQHGGSNSMNCKPNYVSVMNYNLQFGIPRPGAGFILDYSPPRLALDGSTRAGAPLGTLLENALIETVPIDMADAVNQTVFMTGLNTLSTVNLNARPDWTGDITLPTAAGINIDNGIPGTPASPGIPAVPNVGAPGCANANLNSVLVGDNDWNRISIPFRQFGASAPGVIVRTYEDTPTQEELEQIRQDIKGTDLALTLSASPDPVAAGAPLVYAASVTNNGPNTSNVTTLELEVQGGAGVFGTLPPDCVASSPSALSCNLAALPSGETRTLDLTANVPANLVYDAGAPLTMTARARVTDRAGNDPNLANNEGTVSVKVVAVADLSISNLMSPNVPLQMMTGEQVVVELLSTLDSAGPSSPMDTILTFKAAASDDATVSPTFLTTSQLALRVGEKRVVANYPILLCSRPGRHDFTFSHEVKPAHTPDSDPVDHNNAVRLVLTVECLEAKKPDHRPSPNETSEMPSLQDLPEALSRVGVDYSVERDDLVSWLSTSPPTTAYPAIVATILKAGWRFAAPVYLDVIVYKYEATPGVSSPRYLDDVDIEVLKAAILAASNERYGTEVATFEALLEP